MTMMLMLMYLLIGNKNKKSHAQKIAWHILCAILLATKRVLAGEKWNGKEGRGSKEREEEEEREEGDRNRDEKGIIVESPQNRTPTKTRGTATTATRGHPRNGGEETASAKKGDYHMLSTT